jgi:hypothetical protein
MNSYKIYKALIVIFICTYIVNQTVYASEWEDEDGPMSFQIEMLPWEKVNHILPNETKFTIIDVETGLAFRVQRRAGKQHADVQPLTKEDTQRMKGIYHNQWSWKRRAIIVLINDQMIAASMHGMPHGVGALQNDFPGHFCVHFSGSITHRLKNEDPAHKLMILKAAGKLDKYIAAISPYELIHMFVIAINQGDPNILALSLNDSKHPHRFDKLVEGMSFFGIRDFPGQSLDTSGLLLVDIPVQVDMYRKGKGREKKTVKFTIWREGLTHRWFIDQDALYEELKGV